MGNHKGQAGVEGTWGERKRTRAPSGEKGQLSVEGGGGTGQPGALRGMLWERDSMGSPERSQGESKEGWGVTRRDGQGLRGLGQGLRDYGCQGSIPADQLPQRPFPPGPPKTVSLGLLGRGHRPPTTPQVSLSTPGAISLDGGVSEWLYAKGTPWLPDPATTATEVSEGDACTLGAGWRGEQERSHLFLCPPPL